MARSRQLFRDFGLTLALVLAAVLIFWRTTIPALQKNYELDRREAELLDEKDRRRAELEQLRASERAAFDPIEIERVQRRQHGELGLPPDELGLPSDGTAVPEPSSSSQGE